MAGQRLLNSEIDDRVTIKVDNSIRRVNDGVNGIMYFGRNNDYPQLMEKLINGSVDAKATANIYAKFLAGQGFENSEINKIIIGRDSKGKKITLYSLLTQACMSASRNQGFYIHCNFKATGEVVNTHLKSFKSIRFSKIDDSGYSAKILFYDNWEKSRNKKYKKEDIITYNVFNTEESVFVEQVKKAGGIEKYKGQVYFQFLDNEYFYPLNTFDECYLDLDTQAQISLYENRQIRNGFFEKTVANIAPGGNETEKEEFVDKMKSLLGPGGDTFMIVETDVNENGEIDGEKALSFTQLESNVNPKLFNEIKKTLQNNIRKAPRNVPAILIDYELGNLGNTSGEAVIQATNFYNAMTENDRKIIAEAFQEIFSNFDNPILKNNKNWNIKPLELIKANYNGTT